MSTVGIIAEFNPLHSGHKYLLQEAKKLGKVVCVLSSNFVQRGDTAIYEKRIRAESALLNGADLVVELPVCWSMSTAQNFALGAVSILKNIGCDTLMFGSECGNSEDIEQASYILNTDDFKAELSKLIKSGMTFASMREAAGVKCGIAMDLLKGANNNLAIEYVTAARNVNANFKFKTVKRLGSSHDSEKLHSDFVSASLLRNKLICGDESFAFKYIPENVVEIYTDNNISDVNNLNVAVLSSLRSKEKCEFDNLPDLSEGLENKLYSAIKVATSVDELYNEIKSKRYTMARIRRLVLSAFIGIDNEYFMKQPPYLRVLGFNSNGEKVLKNAVAYSSVPVVKRSSEISNLSDYAQKLFKTECRATDLYMLSLKHPQPCGLEYTAKLIKTEC